MSVNSVFAYTRDLEKPLAMTPLRHALVSGDEMGDRFDIAVLRGGQPAQMTGAGVTAYFIRCADGATVVVNGTASGNTVSVTLPESCYALPGRFTLTVKVSMGGVRHAVFACEGAVLRSSTDTLIDPGQMIPSLDDLLSQIARIEAAVGAAQTAASGANAAAAGANTAAGRANTAAAAIEGADAFIRGMDAEAHTLPGESAPTAVVTDVDGHAHLQLGIPAGKQGIQGPQGIPGKVQTVWGVEPDAAGDARPVIGGRNYLTDPSYPGVTVNAEQANWSYDPASGTYALESKRAADSGDVQIYMMGIVPDLESVKGKTLTLSVEDYACSEPGARAVVFFRFSDVKNTPSNAEGVTPDYPAIWLSEGERKITFQYTKPEQIKDSWLLIRMDQNRARDRAGNRLTIRGIKLEAGNVATDWTPAPEVLENRIALLEQKIEQLVGKGVQ